MTPTRANPRGANSGAAGNRDASNATAKVSPQSPPSVNEIHDRNAELGLVGDSVDDKRNNIPVWCDTAASANAGRAARLEGGIEVCPTLQDCVFFANANGHPEPSDEVIEYFRQNPRRRLIAASAAGCDSSLESVVRKFRRAGKLARAIQWQPSTPTGFGISHLYNEVGPVGVEDAIAGAEPYILKEPPPEFISAADFIATAPDTRHCVKGIAPRTGMALAFGPSNVGKSFIVLDLAAHIVMGRPWYGHRVRKGPVLYIAAEGLTGLKLRLRALSIHHDHDLADLFIRPFPAHLTDPRDVEGLAKRMIEALPEPPVLVVLDTFAGNFGTGSENASEDMAAALCGLRALGGDWLVLAIHHSGHQERHRARGHSSLVAALDVELRITREGGEDGPIRVAHSKVRDGRRMPPMFFELKSVNTGWADEDGKPLDSCVIIPTDPPETPEAALGSKQEAALEAIARLHARNGRPVPLAELLNQLTDVEPHTGKRRRIIDSLERRGRVQISGGEVLLL